MTSFAFILGVVPLLTATGAGAASQQSLGTVVFGGMLASTLIAIPFCPVFYIVMEGISERHQARKAIAARGGDDRRGAGPNASSDVEILHRAADPGQRHRHRHRFCSAACRSGSLPIAQYPQIVPPTIQVSTNYAGASAETMAATVGIPIEQSVNGVEKSIYMQSTSGSDGSCALTVTFAVGTDLKRCARAGTERGERRAVRSCRSRCARRAST